MALVTFTSTSDWVAIVTPGVEAYRNPHLLSGRVPDVPRRKPFGRKHDPDPEKERTACGITLDADSYAFTGHPAEMPPAWHCRNCETSREFKQSRRHRRPCRLGTLALEPQLPPAPIVIGFDGQAFKVALTEIRFPNPKSLADITVA